MPVPFHDKFLADSSPSRSSLLLLSSRAFSASEEERWRRVTVELVDCENVNDKPHTVSGCLFCCQAVLGD